MNRFTLRIARLLGALFLLTASPQFVRAGSEGPGETSGGSAAPESVDVSSTSDDNLMAPRPMGLNVVFSYYTVSGVAFQPRSSATTYAYAGVGCIRKSAGSDFFVTNLSLPDGAQIKYLRIYTYDSAAGNTSDAFITRYNRQGGYNDLTAVTSPSGTGYRTFLSGEISENVDTGVYSYVVNWLPNNNTTALCGIRVAYYAPVLFNAYLPLIRR